MMTAKEWHAARQREEDAALLALTERLIALEEKRRGPAGPPVRG